MPDTENPSSPEAIEAAAAQWLARRDRGLDAREQAELAAWQRADSRHFDALNRLDKVWLALDRVGTHSPAVVKFPAQIPAPRRRSRWLWVPVAVAAAAVIFAFLSVRQAPRASAHPQAIFHPGPERLALEDGSSVELKPGASVEVQFSAAERRVRLVRGEAFFTVAKNAARPFIVETTQVTVRAVGTAFSVGLGSQVISVLVTEGSVQVNEAASAGGRASALRDLAQLGAGQLGTVMLPANPGSAGLEMKVTALDALQIDRALSWQGPRLEFVAMPLGDVVGDFNRHNPRQHLVVHDATTAAILVGGNFRADNVDGFVRLLKVGFGVYAFPRGGDIVLRQMHDS